MAHPATTHHQDEYIECICPDHCATYTGTTRGGRPVHLDSCDTPGEWEIASLGIKQRLGMAGYDDIEPDPWDATILILSRDLAPNESDDGTYWDAAIQIAEDAEWDWHGEWLHGMSYLYILFGGDACTAGQFSSCKS